ncbi:uncharacterized protein BO97DRAFT_430095, partial [Aspergillus homomorphus CBS 101889]
MARARANSGQDSTVDQVVHPKDSVTDESEDEDEDENMDNKSVDKMESTPPIGESRPEVGDWVKDIIRRFTQNRGNDVMNNLFLSDTPNFEA